MSELLPTPTQNRILAHQPGGFRTLAEALDYAARGDTGVNFYDGFGQLRLTLPYRQLRERALDTARRLATLRLARGTRLALIAETGADFLTAFYACQYASLTPCPLPFAVYVGGKDTYIAQLHNMLHAAGAPLILSPGNVLACAQAAATPLGAQALDYARLPAATDDQSLQPWRADEIAYIQFSSGSTAQPKGVLISQRAITANVDAILRHGMRLRADDRAFSWLPLYHDMGLVGFSIAAMAGQCSVDYLAATTFARRPLLWLQLMSANGSSITYAPSFGYRLTAQRYKDESLDLSRLRIAGIGGDMVRPQILETFAQRFAASGFRAEAFLPSYGLAEATLAVTVADDQQPMQVDSRDGRRFIGCGRPLPGYVLQICDDHGRELTDGEIGRIWINGPSLMDGYLNNLQASLAVMRDDGFLDSGDLGYMHNGQLVITGRAKDLILIRGRNIWPQDIEWAAEQITPLREGDAAAIALDNGEDEDELVLLVQCRLNDAAEQQTLRQALQHALNQSAGVAGRIVLIAPHSLPYTSSGKLSRALAKTRYLAGEFEIYCDEH